MIRAPILRSNSISLAMVNVKVARAGAVDRMATTVM